MTTTKTHNIDVGRWGEELASKVLTDQGYCIIERNWHCRHGELDIIATYGDILCVVEVKTRTNMRYGAPQLAVTSGKRERMRRALSQWLIEEQRPYYPQIRFDVVTVETWHKPVRVHHLMGVE